MAELKLYISLWTLDFNKTHTNVQRQLYGKFTNISVFLNNTKSKKSVSHSVVSYSLHPKDCSLPGSSVHGILQARILEWVAIPFSRGS